MTGSCAPQMGMSCVSARRPSSNQGFQSRRTMTWMQPISFRFIAPQIADAIYGKYFNGKRKLGMLDPEFKPDPVGGRGPSMSPPSLVFVLITNQSCKTFSYGRKTPGGQYHGQWSNSCSGICVRLVFVTGRVFTRQAPPLHGAGRVFFR